MNWFRKKWLPQPRFLPVSTPPTQSDSSGLGDSTNLRRTLSRASTNLAVDESTDIELSQGSARPTTPSQRRTINVILFGEPSVGKSSVVNLITGREIAKVSSDVGGHTLQTTRYDISFDGMSFCIFDTTGLDEPQIGIDGYFKALERAHELVTTLSTAGGVHLLLFVLHAGEITATMESNYRLFFEVIFRTKVPVVLVFTNPDSEAEVDWLTKNRSEVERCGVENHSHACITAVQGDNSDGRLKYAESQKRVRELLKSCSLKDEAFLPDEHSWLTRAEKDMRFLITNRQIPGEKDTSKALMVDMSERGEGGTSTTINRIRFHLSCDLTGQVTKSTGHPFASGGFGDIYKGNLNRQGKLIVVAIKTTRVYLEHDQQLVEKMKEFRREITVWSKLKHLNVLPLLGTIMDPSTNPDIPAMVCPWVENGALTRYLDKNKDLSIMKVLVLVNDVVHGLQYLHSQDIVHGDLSGSNVLVDGNGRACIEAVDTFEWVDFCWMDPELLDPEDDSRAIPSKQSDVYSFGSIMLQTLTGCVPYHDLHDQQVVLTIARGMQPRRPDKEVVTDHRWRFIQRCWSPTDLPESRPSSDEIVKFTEKELIEALAPEINALIDSIQFSFHHDLTGCVISSGSYPFASGGLGDIYRGRLNIEGRLIDVAIKTHRVHLRDEALPEKTIKLFRRELTVRSKLKHRNVLPLLETIRDFGTHPDLPAMVCPWVENGSLTAYLARNGDLTVAQRLILVDDVARGLQYLHSQHIVHGDLSGTNVLVDADRRACVTDFGLSVILLTRPEGTTSGFATGLRAKGTLRWMAPELLGLDGSYITPSTQSDVYSFGSIVLQIFTGAVPYYYLDRDIRVILAIATGSRPERPTQAVVTDNRWHFIEWCWTPVDGARPRPSSDEIVEFTGKDLAETISSAE